MRKSILGLLVAASCILTGASIALAAPVGLGLTDSAAKVETLVQKTASGDYCAAEFCRWLPFGCYP
jgi:hypothetical protein